MDRKLLRKVTREFNKYRAPECRARTLRNKDDSLTVEFNGTQAASACCFDENFVDYNYYLEDLSGEEFIISGVEEPEEGRFIVVYRKSKIEERRTE